MNHIFFDAFNRLDKLCGQCYGARHGVSEYIRDMENKTRDGSYFIPNWESDLARLKKYRHKRNRLAHDIGAFDEELCSQEDIDWIENFYSVL